MLIVERQQRLLDILREHKAAQLDDMARALDVSPSTVRRDLEVLEHTGSVKRTHGGAVFLGEGDDQPPTSALSARMIERTDAKHAIGAYAASLVEPNMTLLLDGGSTVIYAARLITARPIQVVTPSLSIANHFKDDDRVELMLTGGSLYPRMEVTVGPIATHALADLHADLLLFSLAGIYGDAAFNTNPSMARVEQAMMRQAARSVMLMDASKFGRQSLVRVCHLDEVETIVTDSAVDDAWRGQLGNRLVIAGNS